MDVGRQLAISVIECEDFEVILVNFITFKLRLYTILAPVLELHCQMKLKGMTINIRIN
jgi:hypothetical protein